MPDPFATITITNADPYNTGSDTTGTFEIENQLGYEMELRTERFFDTAGPVQAGTSFLLDWFENAGATDDGDGLRKTLTLDLGGGIRAITLDFAGFDGSSLQWGDGTGNAKGDATGEDVHAQIAVLDRYLNTARFDGTNVATLSIGEYSSSGRYAPLDVVFEQPNLRFDSGDGNSVYEGSITCIETVSLEEELDTRLRKER